MQLLIYKVKRNFQFELISCTEAEQEILERQRGIITEFEIRPTQRAAELLPCGHSEDNLGGFGGCNPNGSCLVCAATIR